MGAEMTQKQRMKGMSLSGFGRTEPAQAPEQDEVKDMPVPDGDRPQPVQNSKPKRKPAQKPDKQVTVNIKIQKSQQQWLADAAQTVRDNNDEPVPPNERVYPQHLIGVAIAMLQSTDIDWATVRNTDELREKLGLN